MIADNALTPELKAYVADRKVGETLAAYNARAAGRKPPRRLPTIFLSLALAKVDDPSRSLPIRS